MFSLHFFHSKLCTMWLFCISSAMFPDNLQFFKSSFTFYFLLCFVVVCGYVSFFHFKFISDCFVSLCFYIIPVKHLVTDSCLKTCFLINVTFTQLLFLGFVFCAPGILLFYFCLSGLGIFSPSPCDCFTSFLCSLKVLFQNIWLLFCTFCGHFVSLGLIVSPFGNCFLFLWVDCFILCDYLITCCNHFLPLRVFQRLFCISLFFLGCFAAFCGQFYFCLSLFVWIFL